MELEHFWKVNTTADGRHKKGSARIDSGSDGSRLDVVIDTSAQHVDRGRLWYTTDSKRLWYIDDADTWIDLGFRTGKRVLLFVIRNALVVGSSKVHLYAPSGGTWVQIRGAVDVAPAGADIKINVLHGPTVGGEGTIFGGSRRLVITAGTKTGSITVDSAQGDNPTVTADNFVTVAVDQVGSTTAGAELVVQCEYND
jgi:hypothetical protein